MPRSRVSTNCGSRATTASQFASDARAQVAGLEERRRAAASSLQRIESMVQEVSARIGKLKASSNPPPRKSSSVNLRTRLSRNSS